MVLTEKQREELHAAILGYFRSNGMERSYEQFKLEAKLADPEPGEPNTLEKKWVSIVRLQKKIDELEAQIEQMKQEYTNYGKARILNKAGTGDNLIQIPAKLTLLGHRGHVLKVVFHPIFCLLSSASEDGTIKTWDIETGKLEHSMTGHTGAVNSLAFNKTGSLLASCSSDLTIKIWKFETYDCLKTLLGHEHNVTGIDFISTGDHIVSASRDKTIKIWEVSTGFCIKTLMGHNEWVRRIVVHPTLPLMVSCSQDQSVIVWDIEHLLIGTERGKKQEENSSTMQVLNGHEHVVETVAFANDKATDMIMNSEYYKKMQAISNLQEKFTNQEEIKENHIKKPESKQPIIKRAFVASGGRDKLIKIWDIKEQKAIVTLSGHDNWVREIVFHPNGKFLISVADDKSIRMWDLHTSRCIKKITDAHQHFISTIDFSEKYMLAATGSVDNTIKLWDCN